MKKKVDNLGRIILPAEVRRDLGIQVGEELNLDVDDGKIILSRQSSKCAICGSEEVWYKIKNQGLCRECFKEIRCIEEQEYWLLLLSYYSSIGGDKMRAR